MYKHLEHFIDRVRCSSQFDQVFSRWLARYSLAVLLLLGSVQSTQAEDQSWQDKIDPILVALLQSSLEEESLQKSLATPTLSVLVGFEQTVSSAEIASVIDRDTYWQTLQAEAAEHDKMLESMGYPEAECLAIAPVCILEYFPVDGADLDCLSE